MFRQIVSAFVAGLALASAYTQPVSCVREYGYEKDPVADAHVQTGDPTGNPILTPGSTSIVPVGTPYQVTWNPTTTGTVTLVLLRGPSTNVVPLYPIAESIQNTGSYSWTPSTDLDDDTTHYGIQLIVDATGQYQYSTQFGISNPNKKASSSSMSASASASLSSVSASISSVSSSIAASVSSVLSSQSAMISSSAAMSSMSMSMSMSTVISSVIASNGSYVQPTVTSTASLPSGTSSARTTTTSASVVGTNGAAGKAALNFGGAAAMVLAAVAAY